jgi:hypothetical protein
MTVLVYILKNQKQKNAKQTDIKLKNELFIWTIFKIDTRLIWNSTAQSSTGITLFEIPNLKKIRTTVSTFDSINLFETLTRNFA